MVNTTGICVFALDHVVLTVRDIDATCAWYERVLGMRRVSVDGRYAALRFGTQKLNLHQSAAPRPPHASVALPGTADLCFLSTRSIDEIVIELVRLQVTIELGPVEQAGANRPMNSVYIRDPDRNLIEIASYR